MVAARERSRRSHFHPAGVAAYAQLDRRRRRGCPRRNGSDGFRAGGDGRDFARQFPGLAESRESPFRSVSEHPRRTPARLALWRGPRELRLASFWATSALHQFKVRLNLGIEFAQSWRRNWELPLLTITDIPSGPKKAGVTRC